MKRQLILSRGPENFRESIFATAHGHWIEQIQIALEAHLEDLNRALIQKVESLGWHGAALYLVDAPGRALEAKAATDATVPGVIRHRLPALPLAQEPSRALGLCDIEAYTYLSAQAERIIGGSFDSRYNEYVYHTFYHRRYLDRLFIPLVLVRDRDNYSLHQDACRWRREQNTWIPSAEGYQLQPIGTLSVSGLSMASDELVERTLDFATQLAAPIAYRTALQGLCEAVLSVIVQTAGAHCASLHFAYDISNPCLVFERGKGVSVRNPDCGRVGAMPRPDGIGALAAAVELPIRVSGDELFERAPELAEDGITVTDAFPLIGAEGRNIGLIYLHYRDAGQSAISPKLLDLVMFASSALDVALRVEERMSLGRERALAEAWRFTSHGLDDPRARARAMANYAWSLLGCDLVSIVVGGVGTALPAQGLAESAGRVYGPLTNTNTSESRMLSLRVPECPLYLTRDMPKGAFARGGFSDREQIEATAVIPLKINEGNETVIGLMIVDYRGNHEFGEAQRRLLERLACLFAAGMLVLNEPAHYEAQVLQQVALLERQTSVSAISGCRLAYTA